MDDDTDTPPQPRATYDLEGHAEAERVLADAIASGRMHHAWLLWGPQGVGKATLAWRAIRRLLGASPDASGAPLGAEPDDPVCRRLEAGAHGDLLVLERPADARGGLKAEIPVAAARAAGRFFSTTASGDGWRACLVDAADDLSLSAANALLKTLEEPPPRSVFFLVAHSRGRAPVTIRSRCRQLGLTAPGVAAAAQVVMRHGELSAADAQDAARLAHGRPGRALRIAAADAAPLHARLERLWSGDERQASAATQRLADTLSARGAETLRDLFFDFARDHVLMEARRAGATTPALGEAWDTLNRLERDMTTLRMDPRQSVAHAIAVVAAARADAGRVVG